MGSRGVVAVCLALCAFAPAAHASSLPSVPSGHRPGPDVLYAPAPRAPQLENTGVWKAPPILVSGASAYRSGEFLYQDFLYDSHGAAGAKDPADPFTSSDYTFSPKAGTLTYPSEASLRNTPIMTWNAAADELVNLNTSETTVRELERLGLRFTSFLFAAADHLTLAPNDEYGKGAAFLGSARVVRNPAHVTYVIDP